MGVGYKMGLTHIEFWRRITLPSLADGFRFLSPTPLPFGGEDFSTEAVRFFVYLLNFLRLV